MLLPLALLPGMLLAEIVTPARPFSHSEAVRTLAEAHAVVLVATKRCADLFASEEVNGLQGALGLSDAASAEAYTQLLSLARDMNADLDKVGEKAWCDGAYDRFGPGGTKMKGLLKRCDPHATIC